MNIMCRMHTSAHSSDLDLAITVIRATNIYEFPNLTNMSDSEAKNLYALRKCRFLDARQTS